VGRKYASIHIYSNKQTRILSELKRLYETDNSTISKMQQASKVFKNAETIAMFERFTHLYTTEILIVQSEYCISIYDSTLTFQSVEEKAKAFSYMFNNPILYVSNFDDDILIFGLFKLGNLITNRNVGNGLSMYEIPYATIDAEKFCMELKIGNISSIISLNKSEDINYIEGTIGEIFHVQLNLTNDHIQAGINHYKEKFLKNGLHIYKKVSE